MPSASSQHGFACKDPVSQYSSIPGTEGKKWPSVWGAHDSAHSCWEGGHLPPHMHRTFRGRNSPSVKLGNKNLIYSVLLNAFFFFIEKMIQYNLVLKIFN